MRTISPGFVDDETVTRWPSGVTASEVMSGSLRYTASSHPGAPAAVSVHSPPGCWM